MSKVGEAEGGNGRFFGGIPRTELPNEVGSATMIVEGGATYPDHGKVLIDAAGEGAQLSVYVPAQWKRIANIVWLFQRNPFNNGTFNVSAWVKPRRNGEATANSNQVLMPVIANDLVVVIVTPAALWAGITLEAGDMITLVASYEGAGGGGLATNLYFLGAYITED